MAATRYTAPTGLIQNGRKAVICATCGRSRLRRGHYGALQRSHYCSQKCYSVFRQFTATKAFSSQGITYAAGVNPITPGGKSR